MTFSLPDLPYKLDALEPYISAKTLEFHYGKHHAAYVNNLNAMIENHEFKTHNLEKIIKETAEKSEHAGIFNNAAQIWNHTFYWHSMTPKGGAPTSKALQELINTSFGDYQNFIQKFKTAGATQFGSGWTWLVYDGDKLSITKTGNAETPIVQENVKPLLTMDVWEHAYYLDYQNKRPDYIEIFLDHLINWDFVEQNLKR